MRRSHLIELHEQPWYPDRWRRLFQRSLGRGMTIMGSFDNVVDSFRALIERTRPESVLDLCTGSGELAATFWKPITSSLKANIRPRLVLSDLYPDLDTYSRLKKRDPGPNDFYPRPVNALDPPADAPSVWMMMDSFHHFRPNEAREILRNAAQNADGIAIFESTSRTWRQLAQVVVLAFWFTMVTTAFLLRPFRFENLLWGLFFPVVPLTMVFDAFVSNLRTYTVSELEDMIEAIDEDDFTWKVDTALAPNSGGLRVTYLLGWRSQVESPRADR